jgi:acylphosphatase
MKMIYSGRVQGVGFRYFVYKKALFHQIYGSVRNLSDGTVELLINDKCENISEFLASIEKGNGYILILESDKSNHNCYDLEFTIK